MIITGTHKEQVERQARGWVWLWSGDQTHHNVAAPPQIHARILGQEIPGQPLPVAAAGVAVPHVAAPLPQIQSAVIGQQWPWHPGSIVWSGAQAHPNVASGILRTLAGQEVPGHPLPATWPGDQVHPNVAPPPQVQQRIVAQDWPWHPGPAAWPGDQKHPNVANATGRVLVIQEAPPGWPSPALLGWPLPSPLAPASQIIVPSEAVPALPTSRLWPGQPTWPIAADLCGSVEWLGSDRTDPGAAIECRGAAPTTAFTFRFIANLGTQMSRRH